MQHSLEPLIFCVGFNKCGTSALHNLFVKSGIPSIHWDRGKLAQKMLENLLEQRQVLSGYDGSYRAFSDMNFYNDKVAVEGGFLFRRLDADYPGSLFVYNTRDMSAWIRSRLSHDSVYHGSFLKRYKSILNTSNEEVVVEHWMEKRWRLERELTRYFFGNPRFLILDLDRPDVIDRLANFLQCELNAAAWERVNVTALPAGV